MKQQTFSFAGRASNPVKASPAQLAARKRFAEMARSGAFKKATKRKANPASGSNAGEFAMTVNGKTVHRFFVHTSDPWAKSHGFDYQLVSNVTKNGAFVKFTKTRAIVAVDEAADGSAVTEKWEIRNLVFYKTNPAKKTVSKKISQLVHEGYPQRQAVAVALSEQRAGKVKRNPTKTQDIYFVSIMNQDGLQYGVDRRTPVTYTFSAKEPKKAYRSFGLPFNVTSNPKFQEFAKRNKTIVASLNEIIEMMQGFAK
jgi:hypothetical protein